MSKLTELKSAIESLDGLDIEKIKHALALIGEPVATSSAPSGPGTYSGGSNIKIIVLQRGWVYVGKFSQDGFACKLEEASSIRLWGTSRGLGELALNGPTSSTKLDKAGIVRFHELTAVNVIDVEDSKWTSKL